MSLMRDDMDLMHQAANDIQHRSCCRVGNATIPGHILLVGQPRLLQASVQLKHLMQMPAGFSDRDSA